MTSTRQTLMVLLATLALTATIQAAPLVTHPGLLRAAITTTASSSQGEHQPSDAFDGNSKTRWCAAGPKFPQWVQADLGEPENVTGVLLSWERDTEKYRCLVQGGNDGHHWMTLVDKSKGYATSSGLLSFAPQKVRFVRLVVLGASKTGWASLWAVDIHYLTPAGVPKVWRPQ